MFWTLLLSHFIADYPLQTDRIVAAKKRLPGLVLHVSIHLITMLVLAGGALQVVWPYLLALAGIHFGIDAWKNISAWLWPRWVIGPYLLDQVYHLLSILLVTAWIRNQVGALTFLIGRPWSVYGVGMLLVTHVWFISERILTYRDKSYQQQVNAQCWSRMVVRGLLYVGLLPFLGWWGLPLAALALVTEWQTQPGLKGWRVWLTDLGVVLLVAWLTRSLI